VPLREATRGSARGFVLPGVLLLGDGLRFRLGRLVAAVRDGPVLGPLPRAATAEPAERVELLLTSWLAQGMVRQRPGCSTQG